jgi:Short C-terminal domain
VPVAGGCDRAHTVSVTTPEPPQAGSIPLSAQRSHRKAGLALIVAASVLAFFAIFALWVNRQALNTNNFTDSSTKLLQNAAIRTQVAGFLGDEIFTNVDVAGEIRRALPPRLAPLAGEAAGALQQAAPSALDTLLQRPRVQNLWKEANRRAHRRLIQVVNGGGNSVSTQNGNVTLDLKSILAQAQQRFGVGGRLSQKLPADAAQITILRSNQLGFAQDSVHVLRALAIVLPAVAILIFALAVYLARGWRREALRATGLGLAFAGAGVLVGKTLAGDAVVNALAKTESVRPAVQATWTIETSLLKQAAVATLAYGVVVFLGAWLAGPTRLAVWIRGGLAPFLREPRFAWGGLAVIVLLLLVWGPTPATRQAVTALILIGLLVLGTEMLRRQTAREYPNASLAEASQRWQERISGRGGAHEKGSTLPEDSENGARLKELERLARLRDSGVLDEEEFQREKRLLLDSRPTATGASST